MAKYIEKLRIPVRVCQPGEEPVEGQFALCPQSPLHGGPETMLEMLNSGSRVVPFVRAADEAVLLLTRQSIDWVTAGDGVERALMCPPAFRFTREERIEVRFVDGRRIEGLIQMELPEDFSRASDFLNGSEEFYPLLTRNGIVLVNKVRVCETRVFDSAPVPAKPAS